MNSFIQCPTRWTFVKPFSKKIHINGEERKPFMILTHAAHLWVYQCVQTRLHVCLYWCFAFCSLLPKLISLCDKKETVNEKVSKWYVMKHLAQPFSPIPFRHIYITHSCAHPNAATWQWGAKNERDLFQIDAMLHIQCIHIKATTVYIRSQFLFCCVQCGNTKSANVWRQVLLLFHMIEVDIVVTHFLLYWSVIGHTVCVCAVIFQC